MSPDVIVMDVMMPVKDGAAACPGDHGVFPRSQLTGVCIDMMDLEGIWFSVIFSALNR